MKRLCVTGGNGLLGSKILSAAAGNFELLSIDKAISAIPLPQGVRYESADIVDLEHIKAIFAEFNCDYVINTAALTNVDACEDHPDSAFQVNAEGAANVALAAKSINAKLIHVSTDYVFNGNDGPYKESDLPDPISVYGKTKLEGEIRVREIQSRAIIARTMILYGDSPAGRGDFVTWLVQTLRKGEPVRIVDDQMGNPTWAPELAEALLLLMQNNCQGIFHTAGAEIVSRYEFALKIAAVYGLDSSLISAVDSKTFKQKAPRPLNSGLLCEKLFAETGYKFSNLKSSLSKMQKAMGDAAYGKKL